MSNAHVRTDGVLIMWSLSKRSSRPILKQGLEDIGLGKYVPQPITSFMALKEALRTVYPAENFLIRRLKGLSGFVVKNERRGDDDNDYSTVVKASINSVGDIVVIPSRDVDPAMYAEIAAPIGKAFAQARNYVAPASLARSLSNLIMEKLGGTTIRPRGGVYWAHISHLETLKNVDAAVSKAALAGRSEMYLFQHLLDASAVRGVLDSLRREIEQAASNITADVESGELGVRALKGRARQARELAEKIKMYEEYLDISLIDLKDQIGKAETAACMAELEASVVETA